MNTPEISIGQSPSKWAVITGIDYYSDSEPSMNLKGCANDAVLVYNFLRSSVGVPQSNMQLHLARDPACLPSPPDPASNRPTVINMLRSIDQVTCQANPGDFVHIHFSGHGTREPTLHPDKKSVTGQDERLCFTDSEMTDVEFGQKLDDMAGPPYNLVILVTLDCCFSGGATRGGKYSAVRCKPRKRPALRAGPTTAFELSDDSYISGPLRDATLKQGWLYRDRKYNAMTACQPYEKSTEGPDESGRVHGAFTSSLISQLNNLGNSRSFTTYAVLQGVVEAAMKGNLSKLTGQQPLLLGPRKRVLFESFTHNDAPDFAHIIRISNSLLVIDRGRASGARLADVYRLSDPGKARAEAEMADDAIEVMITAVREYESDAKVCQSPERAASAGFQPVVRSGWLAKLVLRTEGVYARILHDGTDSSVAVVKKIQNDWRSCIDPAVPIHLILSSGNLESKTEVDVRFNVRVSSEVLEVLDSNIKPFEHLPTIHANSPEATTRLMHLLRHMQSFVEVSSMRTPKALCQPKPTFELSIAETDRPDNEPKIVSSWKIIFQNLHITKNSNTVLFVTVFNLTPLYGIRQIIPYDEGYGQQVEPGESLDAIVDIEIPEVLAKQYRENPSFRMRDVLKICITTQQTDLRHFELEDLLEGIVPDLRHAKARAPKIGQQASWYIEKEIITRSLSVA
jgi:Caspase domain